MEIRFKKYTKINGTKLSKIDYTALINKGYTANDIIYAQNKVKRQTPSDYLLYFQRPNNEEKGKNSNNSKN